MAYKVTVEEKHLREGVYDGVMTFKCPKCGEKVLAEPDATTTCCQHCDTLIVIDNRFF